MTDPVSCESFLVTESEGGQRLDKFLAGRLPDTFSRSYLKTLIKTDQVSLNSKSAKPSSVVEAGDTVILVYPEIKETEVLPQEIDLDILYEDDDLLVVNKPKGMVVHPAAGHSDQTLVNAVLHHCTDPDTGLIRLSGINGVLRPGIVHRIDKDTTGSVIVCKNDSAHQSIAAQLAVHSIRRVYYALCYGVLKEDTMTVSAPLGRDPKDRKKIAVVPRGKEAVTHITVLERFSGYTWIACRLETGRTHQIRVHMASIGHPLVGDPLYAGRRHSPFDGNGQLLHAAELSFIHPSTGERIDTFAPIPPYLEEILEKLRKKDSI